jgi:CheY-like chemotaxis protein
VSVEPKPDPLQGLRVLVVEDSYFVAVGISRQLTDLGCRIVGPAPTVAAALDLLAHESCDAAVLDINLGSETAEPVARALSDRRVPFLFITGYSSPRLLAPAFHATTRLVKPVAPDALREALATAVTCS